MCVCVCVCRVSIESNFVSQDQQVDQNHYNLLPAGKADK